MLAALKPRRRAPAARGFTLLEAGIALAVVAILATAALPGLGHRLQRQRLQGAAQSLAADLNEARFEAARSGQPLFVQARAGEPWCWAVAQSSGCDCATPVTTTGCKLHAVHSGSYRGVRLVQGLDVSWEPSGGATGALRAAVMETAGGEQLRVEVSPLGRARVCARGTGWPGVTSC